MFIDFSKPFDSIHRRKIEQILLTYNHLKETVNAIMMFYKNTKVMVCSSDGDTDFFDIVTRILKRDALAPYLSMICLDYIQWTSISVAKEKCFTLRKQEADDISQKLTRSRLYRWSSASCN